MIVLIVTIVLLFLCALYLFLIRCRRNEKAFGALRGWSYAHRGFHGDGVPENSMEAFRLAKEFGYGVELDVHLMADGNLAVIHDASLKRTAGTDILIEDMVTQQLSDYNLEGTAETIPQFRQVLDLFNGEVPMIVELKAEKGNHAALCDAVCKMLDTYTGAYCIESFDPRCILWLRTHRPDVIRGQLARNFFASAELKLPWYLKLVLTCHMINFLTMPDFIAYRYSDRKFFGNALCRKVWGAVGVTWTLRSKQDYDAAVADGWIPIFEYFRP